MSINSFACLYVVARSEISVGLTTSACLVTKYQQLSMHVRNAVAVESRHSTSFNVCFARLLVSMQ